MKAIKMITLTYIMISFLGVSYFDLVVSSEDTTVSIDGNNTKNSDYMIKKSMSKDDLIILIANYTNEINTTKKEVYAQEILNAKTSDVSDMSALFNFMFYFDYDTSLKSQDDFLLKKSTEY